MNLNHPALEAAFEEFLGLYIRAQAAGVVGFLGDNKNEGVNLRLPGDAVVAVQLDRNMVVVVNGVLKFDLLQLLRRHRMRVKVLPGGNGGFLDEAVCHRLAQTVAIDDIAKVDGIAANGLGRRCQFQTKDRIQAVDRLGTRAGAVAVRLVHQQN